VVSTIIACIVIPILRRRNIKQTERELGIQETVVGRKSTVPTMGGLIIIASTIVLSIFLFFNYNAEDPEIASRLLPMIFVTIGFGAIGLIDDFKKVILRNEDGLSPKAKMFGLIIIAAIYICLLLFAFKNGTETFIPFVDVYWTMPIWLYIPFALFIIVGTTNAVNLTDGVDGLATTVTTVIMAALTVISIIMGIKEVTIFGCIIMGVELGYLIFNIHPAHIFMGDTGSLLLGGAIAGISLYMKMPLLLLFMAIIPIIETASVILQVLYYKKTKKRLFKMAPIHHHFQLTGWRENKIVIVFNLITIIGSVISVWAIY
jgi:phospho-N-acetylmuramoyl-pentapeptide-transferase